jgi:hypothetical protein
MNLVPCHISTTVNILSFARPDALTAVTEDYEYVHISWTVLKMEAESSPESLVTIHPSTRRHILEARNLYQQCCETSSSAEVDTS